MHPCGNRSTAIRGYLKLAQPLGQLGLSLTVVDCGPKRLLVPAPALFSLAPASAGAGYSGGARPSGGAGPAGATGAATPGCTRAFCAAGCLGASAARAAPRWSHQPTAWGDACTTASGDRARSARRWPVRPAT